MISLNKQYKTCDGHDVLILAIIDVEYTISPYPVIGLVNEGDENGWTDVSWTIEGKYWDDDEEDPADLVEVSDELQVLPASIQVAKFRGE